MDRALNQLSIRVEKLVFDPVEWCTGMRAGVSVGKIGIVIFYYKTVDCPAPVFYAETTRTRIRYQVMAANKDKIITLHFSS